MSKSLDDLRSEVTALKAAIGFKDAELKYLRMRLDLMTYGDNRKQLTSDESTQDTPNE